MHFLVRFECDLAFQVNLCRCCLRLNNKKRKKKKRIFMWVTQLCLYVMYLTILYPINYFDLKLCIILIEVECHIWIRWMNLEKWNIHKKKWQSQKKCRPRPQVLYEMTHNHASVLLHIMTFPTLSFTTRGFKVSDASQHQVGTIF